MEVDVKTLQALINNQVREGKTIEYKREIASSADSNTVPFVATVSSFANTSGGDVLIGVEARNGVPTHVPGVEVDNVDQETLRLEQILQNGVEPRLPHLEIHNVSVGDGRYVWVVRVLASWIAPHRVRRNSKFYARNSAGRYELDVGELRTAFTMSETIATRIRDFRSDRIAKIYGGETPVPLNPGGCMVAHLLPLAAFLTNTAIDIVADEKPTNRLRPMGASGWNNRINLDGLITFTGAHGQESRAYVQMFRTGVVESVSVLSRFNGHMNLPSAAYEQNLIDTLTSYLAFTTHFEIEPPFYMFLSFLGVRGCRFGVGRNAGMFEHPAVLREQMLILPEVVVQNREDPPVQVLRPVFDMVWNAFGFIRSLNYDDQGNWNAQ